MVSFDIRVSLRTGFSGCAQRRRQLSMHLSRAFEFVFLSAPGIRDASLRCILQPASLAFLLPPKWKDTTAEVQSPF